jgi:hypothetical protein
MQVDANGLWTFYPQLLVISDFPYANASGFEKVFLSSRWSWWYLSHAFRLSSCLYNSPAPAFLTQAPVRESHSPIGRDSAFAPFKVQDGVRPFNTNPGQHIKTKRQCPAAIYYSCGHQPLFQV